MHEKSHANGRFTIIRLNLFFKHLREKNFMEGELQAPRMTSIPIMSTPSLQLGNKTQEQTLEISSVKNTGVNTRSISYD